MNSLNLKVFMDFNAAAGSAAARSCLPGRFNCGVEDLDAVTRRHGLSWTYQPRTFRMIACATERNSGGGGAGAGGAESESQSAGSFLSKSQTYALLKQQMKVAAKSEDYKEAARIRDSLKSLENEEPILRLRSSMREAIANERFEDAARYRDELKEIAPHCLLKCSSDATTLGIRVQVRSVYIEGRSQPSKGQYFFAYRIRITNNSTRPVQLLRRHWIITDAKERTENVWGIGVIGEQPVILPNTGFEYSSACPLTTPSGRMGARSILRAAPLKFLELSQTHLPSLPVNLPCKTPQVIAVLKISEANQILQLPGVPQ